MGRCEWIFVGVQEMTETQRAGDWELRVRERLCAGDDRALNEVYDQFASFVYGLALRVIGDTRAAEDVSQDVFVSRLGAARGVRPGTRVACARGSERSRTGVPSTTCDAKRRAGAVPSATRHAGP